MVKRRFMPGGLGPSGDMLRRLQSLQEDLMKAQEEIAAMTITATAGGGAVTATVSGDRRLQSLQIQPEVVDPNDVEMLQDLIVAAVNQALEQAEKAAAARMNAVTSGLGLNLGL
ncbi:MAG: YbaB/EbfC family nucleoid-associated protein [Anaerolineae bacterium]|nr:YbaB/EbfC family nucleoid-associated protein [Anaerolineae bacterium]MDW8069011.1 YbaB/EbfC family nucleoid-associated protein [Anaerolineae bacterium]